MQHACARLINNTQTLTRTAPKTWPYPQHMNPQPQLITDLTSSSRQQAQQLSRRSDCIRHACTNTVQTITVDRPSKAIMSAPPLERISVTSPYISASSDPLSPHCTRNLPYLASLRTNNYQALSCCNSQLIQILTNLMKLHRPLRDNRQTSIKSLAKIANSSPSLSLSMLSALCNVTPRALLPDVWLTLMPTGMRFRKTLP